MVSTITPNINDEIIRLIHKTLERVGLAQHVFTTSLFDEGHVTTVTINSEPKELRVISDALNAVNDNPRSKVIIVNSSSDELKAEYASVDAVKIKDGLLKALNFYNGILDRGAVGRGAG